MIAAPEPWLRAGATVEPLKPTVETIPAAHIAPIVSERMRRGVSQLRLRVCSHDLNPVAVEAAAIAHPAHTPAS